ncbi:transketolase [Enterococcus ureasiticus]|uniref:Carbohydrate degradation protein n=1 Tax=Enterococcus ureasiticus TaxID=903984 RepID=A0A1E5GGQ7_9ENTE|nr:transketolase [Enterococcus ureasiticus]OEG11898.1 carbohydrate degradation protein [Enterococcus ureasiticus]
MDTQKFADQIRYYTMRELDNLGFGHFGGSLSIVETLAVLYGKVLNVSPERKDDPDRDYFVLSKGHAGPALYATLFLKGYFDEAFLFSLNQNGTNLPSHPDRIKTPGVDMTTGSLGQGISAATGIAKGNQLLGKSNYTYAIVGDGELNEGQCWEAFQFAAHQKLDHLIVLVDDNKKQLDGYTTDICDPFDFVEKMQAFGFNSWRVDGSDVDAIEVALNQAKQMIGKPTAIVLDTVKGQGVPYFEALVDNHHVRPDEAGKIAIKEAIDVLAEKIEVNQ